MADPTPVLESQGFFSHFPELLKSYGFFAALLWSCIETDLIFLIIGAFAFSGYLNLIPCFIAAVVGAILHDTVVFWFALKNANWVRSKAVYQKVGPRIERIAQKVGDWELALCRPMYGTRYPSILFWGLQHLSYFRFYFTNGTGLLLWAGLLTTLGYIFGDQFEHLRARVVHLQKSLLIIVIGAIVLFFLARILVHQFRRKDKQPPSS